MRVDIRGRDIHVGQRLDRLVDRHLSFALARFGNVVRSVSVRFADQNGPRGGIDKQCQLVANLGRLGHVVVRETAAHPAAAVARACGRLGHAVARLIDRRHSAKGRIGCDGR